MGWIFCKRALEILKINNNYCFNVYKVRKTVATQSSFLITARVICMSKSSNIPSSFENMIELERERAQKSIIVEINSKDSLPSLCDILSGYGNIFKACHYTVNSVREAVLVEYETREAVENLLKNCQHEGNEILPVHSRLLKFSSKSKKIEEVENHQHSEILVSYDEKDSQLIAKDFLQCRSVDEQLNLLYEQERLDDLRLRLKFIVCFQLENGLSGLFPSCRVLPFGSSINGFGSNLSDLDMILAFGQFEKKNSTEEIYFQMRKHAFNSRVASQRVIDMLGDFLQLFFPSTSQVQRIPRARVPIVKFHHDLTNIDCDLSFFNLSGFYMSELIYIFGHYDKRLYPLVFAVRKWAKANRITQEVPGPWITNFTLSFLVIFFLQTRKPPILPSVHLLKELADEDDERFTDDINCTFQRDIGKIPPTKNTENLGELLCEFFTFCKDFDFKKRAISIVYGQDCEKFCHDSLYIENPLETELNISKNVSGKELERFCDAARQALLSLSENSPTPDSNWGIVSLFGKQVIHEKQLKVRSKSFQVLDLFDGTQQTVKVPEEPQKLIKPFKQKNSKPTETKTKISYGSKDDVTELLKLKQRKKRVKVNVDEIFKQW